MKNKIVILAVFSLLLAVALPACSLKLPWSKAETTTQAGGMPGAMGLDASNITPDARLAIGTLKLEGTELAVSPETATELLPLWKAVMALGSSSNTSPKEMEALFEQIRETLSAEQVEAIEDLDLETLDMQALMQELGVQPGRMGVQVTPGAGQAFGGQIPGGAMPGGGGGGGFPGGGGGPPAGFTMRFEGGAPAEGALGGPVAEGTAMPGVSAYEGTSMLTRMVVQTLIQLLEERAVS